MKARPGRKELEPAAVRAFIEANKRWKGLTSASTTHVYERVMLTLSLELAAVEKANWGKHLNERLGKVAGYECGVAKVRVEV